MRPIMTFADYLEQMFVHPFARPRSTGRRSTTHGLIGPVNPARPVSPTNSRLLASPFRRRLRGQVVGR
ncbi:hypothetical protein [Tautonia plasticadhaerens]|uniref:Uncharacterized protein n=1 Tax=Tautonia plasticadhaerens TaxID=2527974 RepID=A0A518H4A4_9BACT|nr:hypothetical protein [Tautonia plasticadhaerens]QDV35663.1 hypothetical protein ElP_35670 [Tautonia plasticadhaerens]